MFQRRASGVLLHPTSLPGRFGIGDLGPEAYRFIDFLADSGQQVWQVLPLGPTGFGNSPYLCYSAFAGNPMLLNLEWLASEDLLEEADLAACPSCPRDRVDYDQAIAFKMPLLRKACKRFQAVATPERKQEFQTFCEEQAYWLNDYALFMALKEAHDGKSWYDWDAALAWRDPKAIAEQTEILADQIFFHKYAQSEFFRQWSTLKSYANEKGIQIFGDLPIYVAHDSADVWGHPKIFRLDYETGAAKWMAGVPPDYFSETGQLWGNPVYNWRNLSRRHYSWWIERIKTMLEYVDIVRIDHFRGFEAFWAVPQGEKTAMNGRWIKAKGDEFFALLKDKLGELPIVAEDLGVITPDVEALRDKYRLPGMKILHFAFDSDRANPFLPFNYTNRNCIVYTGTHDNDTTVGWFDKRSDEEKARVTDYLGCLCDEGIHWGLIRLALGSVANLAVFPLQDLLGLGSEAKMNTPGVAAGNWTWRYQPEMLSDDLIGKLRYLVYLYGREPEYRGE
ncbi:4-alpha-glucanotransferase [Picosynechococcus sp. PCC 7117]|uniref:4-alpha-glucanotransferase n=1 Tax=Picosynechococcus sp. PCC 7117 TaxID=195498 RepID=UPI000810B22C|nr:4-alpha-glucanotransferase [Picosynechococcus sp. PCC 7117]ANV86293.1 4-alpha-glucanotransferase [Picosynechococcus sp. PCC 7117]